MAKLYILAVGGTGSRVLRSLTMLLAAGVKPAGGVSEIVPLIIDPDASNGDLTRTVSLMSLYSSLHAQLNFGVKTAAPFFSTALTQSAPSYTVGIQGTQNKTFQQFIGLGTMSEPMKAMMRMLFSADNMQMSMTDGFKGSPNIGSVVLNQISADANFADALGGFADGDRLFIVSSIFGGTGASGFPLLLKKLRTGQDFHNFALLNHAPIGAVSVLPYFNISPDGASTIDSSTFISKAEAALAYYESDIVSNQSLDTLYFLADQAQKAYGNHQGNAAQKNDAHLIEMLAAMAALDFCGQPKTPGVCKEFGLAGGDGTVTFASFCPKERDMLFTPLTEMAMMAACLTDKYSYYSGPSFNANKTCFSDFHTTVFAQSLVLFCGEYREWLREMKANSRSLDLFNLETKGKPFEVVTGVKPKSVLSTKSDYDLVTDRLNTAAAKCKCAEQPDRFLEMMHSGLGRLIREKLDK